MNQQVYIEKKKIDKYNELKRRYPNHVSISQESFCDLSLSEIEEAETSLIAAVKSGELKNDAATQRTQRISGAGKSLLQQAEELKGWTTTDDEFENHKSVKINFQK